MNKLKRDLRTVKNILEGKTTLGTFSTRQEYFREYNRRNFIHTVVDGKHVWLRTSNKRLRTDSCELCGKKIDRLNYHHWNPKDLSLGMWLCNHCHFWVGVLEDDPDKANRYEKLKSSIQQNKVMELINGTE
jgi:hypothetical protein